LHVLLRSDRWFDEVDPLASGAADPLVSAIAGLLEMRVASTLDR
jgi:hypothetical protein